MELHGNDLAFELGGYSVRLRALYVRDYGWELFDVTATEAGVVLSGGDIRADLKLEQRGDRIRYTLGLRSGFPTRVRLRLQLVGERDYFHLIPCNIHGDNNLSKAEPGHYPNLTDQYLHHEFSAPLWEFRADRASHPVSMLCCDDGVVGISIEPYIDCADAEGGFVRNGVFAELPDACGMALGYGNDPVTFTNKDLYTLPTAQKLTMGQASGVIYACRGEGRYEAHRIVREMYETMREKPEYRKSLEEAVWGITESFFAVNWSDKFKNFTNGTCRVPAAPEIVAYRPLSEIGWTGGGVIAYPLLLAKETFADRWKKLSPPITPESIFDGIAASYNERSGFFYDLAEEFNSPYGPSRVNGWWTGYPLIRDCHCAYTNGSAAYYLIKAAELTGNTTWLDAAAKVLDTAIELQDDDGNFGFTYAVDRKEMLDSEGFAGCWFAAAAAYAAKLIGDKTYRDAAEKGLEFYGRFVRELSCWGTPMDTWKSVDQEGNLAFIRAAKIMHEITGTAEFLEWLEAGAHYEYLWRYAYKARPEFPPLKDSGWNSCGGSVTSVSNPHIHPMGVFVAAELRYLAEQRGDSYHKDRADDSIAWIMNCLELYPEVSGYGQYGVLTERFCPSDGLVIERYSDGTPASMWFSYNGWGAAAALEGILESYRFSNLEE